MSATRPGRDVPAFAYPVLLSDIGGTNVRLAEVEAPGAPLRTVGQSGTDDYSTLAEAISAHAASFSAAPRSLIVCAAGPLEERRVKLTNARWTIDGPEVAAALGLEQGLLLNDFEAQAIMLPSLQADTTRALGDVVGEGGGTRLVVGAGTGLGVGMLIDSGGAYLPVMTEAGHLGFAASDPFEIELWAALRRQVPRVSGETILSGPGTVRLYKALCHLEGLTPASDDAVAITHLAQANHGGPEARTMRLFWTLTGRFAGGLALGLLARGGVTLSGGILRKLVDFLDIGAFRSAFDDQPPLAGLVRRIPVRLVTDDRCVLDGMAALAAAPQRFLLDYETRLWI